MSNFLKKGLRKNQLKRLKEINKQVDHFNNVLLAMNEAYYSLKDKDITEDNFSEELAKISTFKFNDKQIELLKRDLINQEDGED